MVPITITNRNHLNYGITLCSSWFMGYLFPAPLRSAVEVELPKFLLEWLGTAMFTSQILIDVCKSLACKVIGWPIITLRCSSTIIRVGQSFIIVFVGAPTRPQLMEGLNVVVPISLSPQLHPLGEVICNINSHYISNSIICFNQPIRL